MLDGGSTVEYQKYASELDVCLERHNHCRCQVMNHWINPRKEAENLHNAVPGISEIEYYHT
jgi:hypothetical protein